MKKIAFLLLFLSAGHLAFTQTFAKNAIGIRFGSGSLVSSGAEVTYQRALSQKNRLEINAGFFDDNWYSGFNLAPTYQWVMPLEGQFNWFGGAGADVGSWSYKPDYLGLLHESGFFMGVAGQIGIEYAFDFPLQLSLDYRQSFYLVNGWNGQTAGGSVALSVRYLMD